MTYLTVFSLKFFSITLQLYLTIQGQDDNAKLQRDLDLLLVGTGVGHGVKYILSGRASIYWCR